MEHDKPSPCEKSVFRVFVYASAWLDFGLAASLNPFWTPSDRTGEFLSGPAAPQITKHLKKYTTAKKKKKKKEHWIWKSLE